MSRLRASGDAFEFTADDLALDAAGAEQIFASERVNLSHESAVAVTPDRRVARRPIPGRADREEQQR